MPHDYSNQDLRAKSFRDKDLARADFSGADLRGADFANSNLTGSNLSNSRTGHEGKWMIALILTFVLLAFLAGFIIAFWAGSIGGTMVSPKESPETMWIGIFGILFLVVFWAVAAVKGFGIELGILSIAGGIASIVAVAMFDLVEILFFFVAIFGTVPGVALAIISASGMRILQDKRAMLFLVIPLLLGGGLGVWRGVEELAIEANRSFLISGLAISTLIFFFLTGFSRYFALRALAGDPRFQFVANIIRALTCFRGTNFRRADLSGATFEEASVKCADFRAATIKNTDWIRTGFLEYSRFENTKLEDPRLRKLVVTKSAPGENFDRVDLSGLNLEGAKLSKASFVGANLNESNLKNSDLTMAKLVNAQLYGTDLRTSTLTGAYIQDWGISTRTRFEEVKCEHVFMRLPREGDDNPAVWRKPENDNESFQEGDFQDFIAPIVKTLDLYQSQFTDPRKLAGHFKTIDIFRQGEVNAAAASVTIQQLAREYPDADLEIMAVDGSEKGQYRLQVIVNESVDHESLRGQFDSFYEENKSVAADIFLSYTHIKNQWGEIKEFHSRLENYVQQQIGDVDLMIFFDEKGIGAGENWKNALNESIRNAKLFVLLLSPTWLNSEECRKEYNCYREAKPDGPVLPILWDEIDKKRITDRDGRRIYEEINDIQYFEWLDLQYLSLNETEPKRALGKIAKEIKTILDLERGKNRN